MQLNTDRYKVKLFFPKNFNCVLQFLVMVEGYRMASPTITVRFDKELYDKIKNHPLNTSDLIRTSVVQYMQHGENRYDELPVAHDILQNERQVAQNVPPVKHEYVEEITIPENTPEMEEPDPHLTPIIDELKDKIDELHKEIDTFLEKYDESGDSN